MREREGGKNGLKNGSKKPENHIIEGTFKAVILLVSFCNSFIDNELQA
jgi:hypothetical protein